MGSNAATTPLHRIVVGIDGSEHAADALTTAIRLAKPLGAEIVALHTIPPPALSEYLGYGMLPVELDPAWRREIHRQFAQEWCRPLGEAGVRYRAVERDGRPARRMPIWRWWGGGAGVGSPSCSWEASATSSPTPASAHSCW
jgi:nucleotide-binding universal stress UspA family protein